MYSVARVFWVFVFGRSLIWMEKCGDSWETYESLRRISVWCGCPRKRKRKRNLVRVLLNEGAERQAIRAAPRWAAVGIRSHTPVHRVARPCWFESIDFLLSRRRTSCRPRLICSAHRCCAMRDAFESIYELRTAMSKDSETSLVVGEILYRFLA